MIFVSHIREMPKRLFFIDVGKPEMVRCLIKIIDVYKRVIIVNEGLKKRKIHNKDSDWKEIEGDASIEDNNWRRSSWEDWQSRPTRTHWLYDRRLWIIYQEAWRYG